MKYFLFLIWLLNCLTYVEAQQTINDLTVKDLKVVSTVKGSKPCPLMTQVQRDAIISPLNGQCVYNTTTSKLNIYNGSSWKQVSDTVVLTTDVSGILPIANGGTASSTRPFVDLSSSETIGGIKTFSSTISGSINGNSATVTTNANLSGPITSSGNTTSVASQTGTGSTFVMNTSPTLVTPILGSASGTSLSLSSPLTVPSGGTGLATLTANNVILGNGSSTPLFVAPGTSGNVLTSNGTTWTSGAPAGGTGTTIPGYVGSVDIFPVSFGTTNIDTVCSASPCFIRQVGTAVSSITRASTGDYSLVAARTYNVLICTISINNPGNEPVSYNSGTNVYTCDSCTTIKFGAHARGSGAALDVLGSAICIGTY